MKSLTLKVALALGTTVLIAGLALMIWAGFAMSSYGG